VKKETRKEESLVILVQRTRGTSLGIRECPVPPFLHHPQGKKLFEKTEKLEGSGRMGNV